MPTAMEEHWRAYSQGDWLHIHRSWTGMCIYRARIAENQLMEIGFRSDAQESFPDLYAFGPPELFESLARSLLEAKPSNRTAQTRVTRAQECYACFIDSEALNR